eukprot:scaffold8616_cov76-Phaeocystis_antarctica.AAC.4
MATAASALRTSPDTRDRLSSTCSDGSSAGAHAEKSSLALPCWARPVADASSTQRASLTPHPSSMTDARKTSRASTAASARLASN